MGRIEPQLIKALASLASVVEARDSYTGGHIWRVSQYAKLLAEKAGLPRNEIFLAELNGLVHDIGKIGISDIILNKEGKLTDEEFQIMKTHVSVGKKLIEEYPMKDYILESVYRHHERVDGKGYPNSSNRNTSAITRIISIADTFDAMTSTRAYRKAMDISTAMEKILAVKGTQLDATLVDEFEALVNMGKVKDIVNHCGFEKPLLSCKGCGPIIAYSKKNDGDDLVCPHCRANYTLHRSSDNFDMEFKGYKNFDYVHDADEETIEIFVSTAHIIV